jgi:hypothetical protein
MKDRLPGVGSHVVDRAVSVFEVAFACDLRGHEVAVSDQLSVCLARFLDVHDVLLGDNQHVGGRLRPDVFKSEGLVVFVNFPRRDLAGDDLAEKTVGHNVRNGNRRGFNPAQFCRISLMKLDELMPAFDVAEEHHVLIAAPCSRVWQELFRADFSQLPVVRRLMRLRSLGRRLEPRPQVPTLEAMARGGFLELARLPGQEIIFGLIGRFWRPVASVQRGWQPDEFALLVPTGSAKAVWNFALTAQNGSTLLTTATRVQCFGRSAKIKFRIYWMLIGFFSGWIRKAMLRAIKLQAEYLPQVPRATANGGDYP